MRTFIVIVCAFLSVFLTNCGPQTVSAEVDRPLRPSEPRLISETLPSTSEARLLYRHDPTSAPWPWDDLPLQADVGGAEEAEPANGAPPPIDDLPDASINPPDVRGNVWMEPTLRLLAANTCNDRPLRLSPSVQRFATAGYALWHVCYETPTSVTSQHPFATERPTQIVFHFFHESSQTLREIARVAAPRGTMPWTVNALVILPPGTRPLLNLENRYANGDHLYAIQPLRLNEEIQMHGVLQPWRVNPDGTQTLSVPGVLCMYVSPANIVMGREYFFVPHTNCPNGVESYRLNAYECSDLFASPL